MFSSLARSRALAFFFFLPAIAPRAYAFEDSLFTSSVTYCNPPETLLIERFEVAYFPSNNSVSFNVSAASVQSNVNVTANLFLNVYGMNPVNMTVDLCGILGGALCPLPMYNFTGADSITLPPSVTVTKSIPGIAYKIPDLEGFAQLSLTEIKTGALKACVQATLSNGRSAHQPAVEWTTGGVTIAALLIAIWQSILSPQAILPFRLLELITLFQIIATSSFLNLNYPSVYRAFTINFSWAMGLISASSVQNSINHMRHLTGGNLADATGGSAVGLVNRKLSPYNSPSANFALPSYGTIGSILSRSVSTAAELNTTRNVTNLAIVDGEVQTVTAASSNILQAGVPIYVNTLHIATANAFMTVFLCALIVIAVVGAILGLGHGVVHLAGRVHDRRHNKMTATVVSFDYSSFCTSWSLRVGLVMFLPLLTFILYQWTLKDSWLSVLLSVFTFIATLVLILFPLGIIFRNARRDSAYSIYSRNLKCLSKFGPLYAQYRPQRYFFSVFLLGAFFLRALFIAAAKSSGEAQLALIIVSELCLVLGQIVLKPATTRGGDVLGSCLAILRLVCAALMIAFIESLAVKAIPRVVIGIVIALAWSIAVLVLLGSIAWNTIAAALSKADYQSANASVLESPVGSEGSMLEKGIHSSPGNTDNYEEKTSLRESLPHSRSGSDAESAPSLAEVARARPVNPTPENNVPFDRYNYDAYPVSPTATTISTMEPPSLYSRDSGTMTVGSLLPRRWSFSLSQPTSPAGSTFQHRNSLTPSSVPPSPHSDAGSHSAGGAVSRTASSRAPPHQPTHEDIQEEEAQPPPSPVANNDLPLPSSS